MSRGCAFAPQRTATLPQASSRASVVKGAFGRTLDHGPLNGRHRHLSALHQLGSEPSSRYAVPSVWCASRLSIRVT